jgi:hypothetical protein
MASPCPTPGYSIMIFDDSGHREMDGVTLQVYPEPAPGEKSADYSQIAPEDPLAGTTATVTGIELLDGQQTLVVETTLSYPGVPSTKVTANLDPSTGLRVRETWVTDSQTMVTERKLVDPTPELLAKLEKQSIMEMASAFREQRSEKLKSLAYPVWGLPETPSDFRLLWVIPGRDWGTVRLEYEAVSSPGHPSVTVITTDLTANPKDAQLFTASRKDAVAQADEGGDVLRFRQGDTGIQVQAGKDIIRAVAGELIQVWGGNRK